ncbi:TetR/AcrR family transcriptional regulator [Thermosyntropha lipolytica]|nr:TetR/AcrR family transcriptional regulator [Thermosyntropha lipolytica]
MREMDDKKAKRELILDAAVRVFSRRGYHEARMEEIALEAGIGKGTIYEYFDSKLTLFQEVLGRSRDIYYNSLAIENENSLSLREKIRLVFLSHIRFCQENKELTRVVFWDTEIMDEELKAWSYEKRKEKERMLSEVIEKAMEAGEIRGINPYALTLVITGALGALWLPIVLEEWSGDAESLAGELTDIIFEGIKG